jgi:hypothetical protein
MNSLRRAGANRAVLLVALVAGCATPVGVSRVDSREIHHELTQSVLSGTEPSAPTRVVLERLALAERYDAEPEVALAALHGLLGPSLDPDLVYALAELSFLHAEAEDSRSHFLAAAVYAYAFLFPGVEGAPPKPFDPRRWISANLYNLALAEALRARDGPYLMLRSVPRLPFGSVEIRFDYRSSSGQSIR